ncbi:MAG: coproporphyrinogen III oxidase [Propionibacterium sp.]|nr:coproporphyrinogen III oxidase [Propionibacterium sp.]
MPATSWKPTANRSESCTPPTDPSAVSRVDSVPPAQAERPSATVRAARVVTKRFGMPGSVMQGGLGNRCTYDRGMPSQPPPGEAVPSDGSLPTAALAELPDRGFGVYLHVPFCASRCGYCDFNTYTSDELGPGADRSSYPATVRAEIELAARVLGPDVPPVSTVFVGGGTPTLLPSATLVEMLAAIGDTFGLAPGAEVTTEANPESVTPDSLAELAAGGFTRVSFGMQSARSHVLRVLDREHSPGRAVAAVAEARTAGFEQVSLDLIHGTPGETLDDWRASLEAAIGARPDHISAYSLIVEDGTRLGARVRRGELPMPDEDEQADKYLLAEELLTGAGYHAYEISNWATDADTRCRHNLAYWQGGNWWGFGPGAHSHVGGVRWWNVRHPARYAELLTAGGSPGEGRELLDDETRRVERVLLELRLVTGLSLAVLTASERARVPDVARRGLVTVADDRLHLTLPGRLLADAIIRDLLD